MKRKIEITIEVEEKRGEEFLAEVDEIIARQVIHFSAELQSRLRWYGVNDRADANRVDVDVQTVEVP